MSKELIVSSTPHETKVAVIEDDQVVEVYFEREQEYSLAGSVFKGRVTRVLPGMQSAFVNVGLERDAFLYVSDFFEDTEEYDQVVTATEEKVAKMEQEVVPPIAPPSDPPLEASQAPIPPAPPSEMGRHRGHSRRRRGRGKGFPESKYAGPVQPSAAVPVPVAASPAPEPVLPAEVPIVLPGESLAKYRNAPAPVFEPELAPEPAPEPEPQPEAAAPIEEAAPAEEPAQSTEIQLVSDAQPEISQPQTATFRGPEQSPRFPHHSSRRNRRKGPKDHRGPGREEKPSSPEPASRPTRGLPLIGDLLHEGQEIIVQIAKEPIGKKGARITSHIALPGRYLVYMPTVDHVGVSRRIASEEERHRLKRQLTDYRRSANMPGGFIVRTAAEGHSDDDLREDMRYLFSLWKEIRAQAERQPAPALLHRDLNLVQRILRDQFSQNFTAIWVDNETEYAKVVDFVQMAQPSLVGSVKLYLKDTPIFDEFGVQEEINNSLKSKVWLKSGGYIVINQTEALVAIDVNTGKYVGKTQRLEDTIVKTNVDAIREIVRQIRLRDLGGIIVIDFIDMDERKNRQRVMQALEEALRQDRAPSKALAFNDFGLVAITRKRVKQPIEKALGCACPYCTGSGWVKSAQTVSLEIYSEARKMAATLERPTIILRVNPEVAKYLKQSSVTIVRDIEEMTKKPVLVKGDPLLHHENFDFH